MASAKEYDETASGHNKNAKNPVWFKPTMFGFLLIGFIWILVYYIFSTGDYPIPGLGSGNLIIGFGLLLVGLLLTTRWR